MSSLLAKQVSRNVRLTWRQLVAGQVGKASLWCCARGPRCSSCSTDSGICSMFTWNIFPKQLWSSFIRILLVLAIPVSSTLHIGENLHLENLIPRKRSICIGPLVILSNMWVRSKIICLPEKDSHLDGNINMGVMSNSDGNNNNNNDKNNTTTMTKTTQQQRQQQQQQQSRRPQNDINRSKWQWRVISLQIVCDDPSIH